MSSTKGPARGTRIKGGRYYRVRADGKRRIWIQLTKVSDGLPAFYAALAKEMAAPIVADDLMPRVIAAWEAEGSFAAHSEHTQRDERSRGRVIAEAFAEFRAKDVEPKDVSAFLLPYKQAKKAKTHDMYRAQIRDLMCFSILKGWRPVGSDPVTDIVPTMGTKPRDRYITDSEMRRIKVAAIYATRRADQPGSARQKNRSGLMLCALIDMAYLTGQRIGDLLDLEWKDIGRDGVLFKPSKTEDSTSASVMIGWTPKLEQLVARLKALRVSLRAFGSHVFVTQTGRQSSYSGAHSAWERACERAGVQACTFNDLRAKALTDTEEKEGMQAARRKGLHSTEQQTSDYVRHKKPQQSKATR